MRRPTHDRDAAALGDAPVASAPSGRSIVARSAGTTVARSRIPTRGLRIQIRNAEPRVIAAAGSSSQDYATHNHPKNRGCRR